MAKASVRGNRTNEGAATGQPVDEDQNYYATLTPERRIASALEMAQEINEHHEKVYCVISAAVDYLKESPDDSTFGLSLAQVAEELMRDMGQNFRLVKCLETSEAAHG